MENMQFDIDIAMFLVFLALNLAVGLYYGRGVKTIRDYALGGRNFSTGALVSTIVATWVGGDYLFITLAEVYTTGLHYTIGCLGMVVCLFLNAYVFVPRMQEFLGSISVADSMGNLYGKHIRIITAISGAIASAGFVAVQFKVFGNVLENFVGLSGNYHIFLAAIIVVIYSAFGGIRAVTFTDIIQFFTFGVLIPVLGAVIWHNIGNSSNFSLVTAASHPLFNYQEFIGYTNPKFWSLILLFLLFSLPDLNPSMFQRVAIGRSIPQVKKAFTIAAILLMLILLGMAWIAFLVFNVNPNLQPGSLVQFIMDTYSYPGLKSFILIGVVAMCMSSADSNINSASVLLTHDFCSPLNIRLKNELTLSKIISVLIGLASIWLALLDYDLLPLVFMTQSFYIPIVDVPLILAILGFRSTSKSVLIGMVAAFISVIIWRMYFMNTGVDSILPGTIVNLIFLMGSHYLLRQQGGWINKTNTPALSCSERLKLFSQKKTAQLLAFVKNLRYIKFCRKYAPDNELVYMWVGIYFIVYTFFTMYSTHVELIKDSTKTILSFYQLMMVSGTTMAMYPIWPLSVPQYIKEAIIKFLWFIEIFYMFGFFSTFFVLLSNFGAIQTSLFTINMVATVVVTGVRIGLTLLVAGFYLGICFYKYYTGIEILDTSVGSPYFVFTYSALFMSAALAILLIPKEKHQELLTAKNVHLNDRIDYQKHEAKKALELKDEFLRNIQHESRTPITGITSMGQILYEGYDKLTEQQRREGLKDIVNSSARLDSFVNNLVDLSKISNLTYELNRTMVDLSKLVYNRLTLCKKLYVNDKKELEFITEIENNIILNCDEYYISAVLDNLIMNAIQYSKKQSKIIVKLNRDSNTSTIHFMIKDEGIGIPKEELFDIFGAFVVSSKTRTPAGGRGVGLALCKKAIELHGGTITADSDGKNGSSFEFILPEVTS